MDLWAVLVGCSALLALWLFSRPPGPLGVDAGIELPRQDKDNRSGDKRDFSLIEAGIAAATIGILVALALPAYQDYTARSQATSGAARLSGALVNVAELQNQTQDPHVLPYLEGAQSDIAQARTLLVRGSDESQRLAAIALIRNARGELDRARNEDPGRTLDRDLTRLVVELDDAEQDLLRKPPPTQPKEGGASGWTYALLSVLSLFALSFLAVYVSVIVAHGQEAKPIALRRQLRARLEPLVAFFAVLTGIVMVMTPGLEQATSLFGAGISGSGFGYWVKSMSG